MGRPKSTIVLTNSSIEEAFANGRVTLAMLATAGGVSVPTMRKHLAATFGDRITFRKGRTGGLTLTSKKFLHTAVEAQEASQSTIEDPIAS
jgi:hypothetical protein